MFSRLASFARALVGRRRFEDGIADEVRFHIEQFTQDLIASGVAPADAARQARIEFGNINNVTVDCREARGLRLVDELCQNVRFAVRMLRRTPTFTAGTLATLALCLGSTLTIFAVVDSVLLRPLPFPASDDLVSVFNTYPRADVPNDGCSLTNYYERRGQLDAFVGIAAYHDGTAIVGDPSVTEREQVSRVSPDFFATLGLVPVLGRTFTEAETVYAASRVAILTDNYWKQRLHGDPNVIGRGIRVDGVQRTVVGVLPPQFSFLSSKARLYFPLASDPEERSPARRHSGNARMIARLRPGVAVAEAQSQVDAHNAALERTNPDAARMAEAGFRSVVVPLHADHVASVRGILLLLQAGTGLLLLIGVVNVTNLFLIRAGSRMKELAVRQAIGAGRGHIVREVMVETLLVAMLGGVLGVSLGAWGIALLRALGADHLPLGVRLAFDARLALTGICGGTLIGAAIAVPIAWYHLRIQTASALLSESRGATAGGLVHRVRQGFVIAQIALAFVLLSGAGLLALSLREVTTVFPGFHAENILTGQMTLPGKNYPDRAALLAFVERLTDGLNQQPGVVAAGISTNIPLSGIDNKSAATVRGHVRPAGQSLRGHYSYGVGGDYFHALGHTLREGRYLTPADSRTSARNCVVDEDFARHYWPTGRAIGQQVFQGGREGADAEAFSIVGVVDAIKQSSLTEETAQGAVYYPFGHRADRDVFVVTRTSLPPEPFGDTLRDVVRTLDPELPVSDVQSMAARIAASLVPRRSPALLAGIFSAIALLLAAIGTYGVLSYAVAERRREIGLRMALGARPAQIRSQFMSVAVRLLILGSSAGLVGAWLTGRLMQAILFHVPAVHWLTLATTTAVISVVSLAACLVPALRAARISPLEAMSD
ncbi:MAG: ABC transporter permease [Acidobacteria bacterium]|nr:ABC transporter permease [Acidobacteriota bacterium]